MSSDKVHDFLAFLDLFWLPFVLAQNGAQFVKLALAPNEAPHLSLDSINCVKLGLETNRLYLAEQRTVKVIEVVIH